MSENVLDMLYKLQIQEDHLIHVIKHIVSAERNNAKGIDSGSSPWRDDCAIGQTILGFRRRVRIILPVQVAILRV